MAAIIRFFSKRFGKKKGPSYTYAGEVSGTFMTKKTKKSDLECRVAYLDGTAQTFFIPVTKDPYAISLKVKFFSSDPTNLQNEYTRYLFTLQLRADIQSGKLICHDLHLAAELSALLLQAEFGDYDPNQHTPVFVSTFRFLPEQQQTQEFEASVLQQYKLLRDRNMTPANADSQFLNRVCHLPDYGVDMHKVMGKDKQEYTLGLTPAGILIYEGEKKLTLLSWRNILKLEMRRKQLNILVLDEDPVSREVIEHAFHFVLPSRATCKQLWKSAVEHHVFFRLTDHSKPPPVRSRFFRLRSGFYASFKNTEYQLHTNKLFGSSSFRKHRTGAKSAPETPTLQRGSASPQLVSSPSGVGRTFKRVPSKRFKPQSRCSSGRTARGLDDDPNPSYSPTSFVTTANVENKNASPKCFTWRNQQPQLTTENLCATPDVVRRKVDNDSYDKNQVLDVTLPTQRITPVLPRMGYRLRKHVPPPPNEP